MPSGTAQSAADFVVVANRLPVDLEKLPDGTQYYEIVLSSQSGGNFALRRFRSTKGQPGRDQVDITVTHEVLLKLADDLVSTLPQTP